MKVKAKRCTHKWWSVGNGIRWYSGQTKADGTYWCKSCGNLKIINSFGTFYERVKRYEELTK